jgi:hypothetical protein
MGGGDDSWSPSQLTGEGGPKKTTAKNSGSLPIQSLYEW